MSSINPYFTFHYSQPEEYHFSHDSVFLARRVFELEGSSCADNRVLDLCAGCGIVGLDFLFHCQTELGLKPLQTDFIEVQEIYREHFFNNTQHVEAATCFLVKNYAELIQSKPSYDLILCNPPYFLPGTGKLSPSSFKNRCRFFLDSDFPHLIAAIQASLRPNGRAYLLVRGPQGRISVAYTQVGDIRGTALIQIRN